MARKLLLPKFELTELTDRRDPAATQIDLLDETYYVRPKFVPDEGKRRDGKPRWVHHQFNLYPVVLDSHGVPWAEANVYLLSRLESVLNPVMSTYAGVADDLAVYRRFLDEHDIDWMAFPAQKLTRPTYRFNGHLKFAISAGETAAATAKRRMSTVVNFYRWLANEGVFTPANPAWRESDHYVQFQNAQGFSQSKKVVTTDLHVKVPRQEDPYDGLIDDGGKLRPLSKQEQEWLVDALVNLGNTEMTLIHLFSLLTGARIQTALTLRVRHALLELDDEMTGELRFPVGPGTGVDTKNDKQIVLHIPVWFYRMLKTYALSGRARQRRERAIGEDTDDQYLFLSQRGAPLYQAKDDARTFDRENELRHQKVGQGVRQFITERVVPLIRKKHNAPAFAYQFHDTRATAGMNWTDRQLLLVSQGEVTLHEAREFVRVRMGHESSAVTDRYLKYRQNLKLVRWVAEEHESHLKALSTRAMEGLQ
jgi:site-specific recombinase XerD